MTDCKIKVVKEVMAIYPKYRPKLGETYDAQMGKHTRKNKDFVVLDILDKKIVLRNGEYEVVQHGN